MRRLIKVSNIVFLLFLMAGCSVPKTNVDNFQEAVSDVEKDLVKFTADDNKIEIVMFNKGDFPEDIH
ncbi:MULTISPECIES: hypothetical protein [Cytobacillus]|uniref:hypothetical protein n=1 Tax=Cytobacillus TaxID=2675230 RepID=UPI00203B04CF|nr:hypothetical protein [Cytobacillus firmus]MCM3707036.1 hypothetical protein [Cytobacillus firmus]